jgi:predicted nucleic acid-binding Zn ribbon protein
VSERKRGYPTPVAALLTDAFRGKPLEKRLEEAAIWRIWDETVGARIAAKARPSRFNDGVLTVIVNSSPWMQQLNFMKQGIATRLNEKLGKEMVLEIYLKAGRPQKAGRPESVWKQARRELSDREKESIGEMAATITDPELRSVFIQLLSLDRSTTTENE